MKKIAFTLIFALGLIAANAQYKNSLGLAFGYPTGIQYKTFISNDHALDFTLGGFTNYFYLSGAYEIHGPLAEQVKWYVGPGAHVGFWNGSKYTDKTFLGLDGILGIELKPNIPFAFSLDLRPGVNLIGNNWDNTNHYFWWGGQFGIRYTF